MKNITEFLQNNKDWLVPIIIAIISGFFYKKGKTHKQKIGAINNSDITNINGDINKKVKKR